MSNSLPLPGPEDRLNPEPPLPEQAQPLPPLYRSQEIPRLVQPQYRPRRALPIVLLLATLLTTTVVGARLALDFRLRIAPFNSDQDVMPFGWAWQHPAMLVHGLPFSICLLLILLCHELGHYLACRYYRIPATWPHFIPAPTLIGTMGAFIRIRGIFPNRRALFDVGAAGPYAGFVLAVPLLVWGLAHSIVLPQAASSAIAFAWPPLGRLVLHWLYPGVSPQRILMSPLARAAWIGLFVTMLNLVPGAQLDGGHVLYCFSPRLHRWVSLALLPALLWMGWRFWPGWYVWAVFLLLMRARHPFVPPQAESLREELGATRLLLGAGTLFMLLLTLMLAPFRIS